ncbi:O-antigen polysaccharide polymerase Wzy family protein [Macrococcus sp. FSL R5-0951]
MNNSFRLVFIIFTFLLFLLGLFNDNLHILFWSVMLQFIHNFWYSLINIYNRIIFLCFNVSIFIFLFGRLFVSYFFGYKSDISGILGTNFYEASLIVFILKIIYTGLITLYIGFKIYDRKIEENFQNSHHVKFNPYLRITSLIVFYITIIFKVMVDYEAVQVASSQGYFEYFSTFKSSLPSIVVILSKFNTISFFIYLSTRPIKKRVLPVTAIYLAVNALSLLTGSRSNFMLNVLIIIIYFGLSTATSNEKWFGKMEKMMVLILIPVLMVVMTFIGEARNKYSKGISSSIDTIFEFFYSQGVSVNIIGYTKLLEKSIPDKIYSFGPFIEYFRYNILSKFQDVKVLEGQSVERALEGYQYSHTMSYLIMPDLYIRGVGYGSSYMAELFHDFGWIGLIIGGMLFGIIIGKFTLEFNNKSIFIVLIVLMMTRAILFVPRASTVYFIINTFIIENIVGVIVIFSLAFTIKALVGNKYESN